MIGLIEDLLKQHKAAQSFLLTKTEEGVITNHKNRFFQIVNQYFQAISNQKLLISIDQEGGVVQRLKKDSGFVDTLSAKDIATNGEDFAKQSYKALAKDLKDVGINLDFAPVVDLSINKNNKVIVTRGRSFGESSSEVIKYSSIFVDELRKQNVMCILKLKNLL